MKHLVAPSILSADFGNLEKEVRMINESQADWLHVDIMDGVFVPNLSMGIPVVEAINRLSEKPLDVHLMIVRPEDFVEAFHKAGARSISVHIETCRHLHRNIQQIKALNCKAGVAVNPHTAVGDLENVIADIDLICLMAVNPGFGGQQFIGNTFEKIKQLRNLIAEKNSKALIEIDGGVTLQNAKSLIDGGADVLVAGNCVFSSANPKEAIRQLKSMS
jgi:ribulose-phosphate 3-epimerase